MVISHFTLSHAPFGGRQRSGREGRQGRCYGDARRSRKTYTRMCDANTYGIRDQEMIACCSVLCLDDASFLPDSKFHLHFPSVSETSLSLSLSLQMVIIACSSALSQPARFAFNAHIVCLQVVCYDGKVHVRDTAKLVSRLLSESPKPLIATYKPCSPVTPLQPGTGALFRSS